MPRIYEGKIPATAPVMNRSEILKIVDEAVEYEVSRQVTEQIFTVVWQGVVVGLALIGLYSLFMRD